MLEHLHLRNVGPAPELELELAPRLNLITGDNGLGKSFLLDVMWWALTQTWAREMARPAKGIREAEISFGFDSNGNQYGDLSASWDSRGQDWRCYHASGPRGQSIALYAHVDGGFAVWDSARSHWRPIQQRPHPDDRGRVASYIFKPDEVWEGLEQDGAVLCEGLIRDWASWQKESGKAFAQLTAVLEGLSPSSSERLIPGGFARIGFQARDIPTLRMPYDQEVPVVHASAGMRRIIALAYMLVWTWQEHVKASELIGEPPASEITFLVDELEAHLHPQWQRRILRSLLGVMEALTGTSDVRVQLVTVTHSPIILLSTELAFDPEQDAWFDLDLDPESSTVRLERHDVTRRGTVGSWLRSEAFDFRSERTPEAEEVLERAAMALSDESLGKEQAHGARCRAPPRAR